MSDVNVSYTSSSKFDEDVIKSKLPVVLDFYSTECPPCEALAPKFESLAEAYDGKIAFIKIFRQENKDVAAKLGVSSSPTVLFFKNGEEVGSRLSGNIKKSEMKEIIEEELLG
jgi:thioredoxin